MNIHKFIEEKASGQTQNHLCNNDDAADWCKVMWQPEVGLKAGRKSAVCKIFYFYISWRIVEDCEGIILFCTLLFPLSSQGIVLTLFLKLG